MDEIASSLIAVVLVMCSVFIPAAFLPGTTGQLYKQFAITIVISVAISGFIALTLSPAMCAVLLKHSEPPKRGPFAWFNRGFEKFTHGFGALVVMMIKRKLVARVVLGFLMWGLVHLFKVIPTAFVPNEDQGYVMAQIIMPDAASMDRTVEMSDKIETLFAKHPAVENRTAINGYSFIDSQFKPNVASFFVTFKDFKERY